MLLGEPPRSQGDLNFSLLGIPVRVHPMFWVIAVFLGLSPKRDELSPLVSLLSWVVAVFVSILIHELGHALAMRAYGLHPWITLHGMGGLTSHNPTGSYHSPAHSTLGQVSMTAAGPAAQLLLTAIVAGLLNLAGHEVAFYWFLRVIPWPILLDTVGSPALTHFLNDLLFISVFWPVLNMLPVYPLDGGQIAREVLLRASPRDGIRMSLILSMVCAVAMALFAFTQWHSLFTTLFFAYLAYSSYVAMQSYMERGPF